MFYFKWPTLLLPIFISTFLLSFYEASSHHAPKTHIYGTKDPSFSDGSSENHHLSTKRIQGDINDDMFSWRARSLLEDTNGNGQNSSLLLAVDRTHRIDPKDNQYYTGGWNISNQQYIRSVGYSASGPFFVAALWLLGFGLFLIILCIYQCCCGGKVNGYSEMVYTVILVILIVVTVDTLIGSGILFKGQDMFHKRTSKVLNYIIDQANTTSDKLKIVYTQLSAAKEVAMDKKVALPPDILNNVDNVLTNINSSVTLLDQKREEIPGHIKRILDKVILSLIIISTFMLVFTVAGLVLSYLGLPIPVYVLVFIGWILVTDLFLLCGIFLLFHNAVGDTCMAMDQWVQNPTAHTALDDLLSCPDNATSEQALIITKNVTVKLLTDVNQFVLLAGNANFPPEPPPKPGSMNFNQSGPLIPPVCCPFYPDLSDRKCADGEVPLANATELYKTFVCKVSAEGICTSKGRMTPEIYSQLSLATNVSFTLHHYGPFLVDLMDCSFAREAFSLISKDHCPELFLYSNWIYIGLAMVASGVMISVLFWGPYAQRKS